MVVDIARGFHMNSHKPSDEYLIPTTLTPQLPAGLQLADTIYPNGRLEKFSFSPNKPLDVYTGSVTLKLRLVADANAPLGPADHSRDLALSSLQRCRVSAAGEGSGDRRIAQSPRQAQRHSVPIRNYFLRSTPEHLLH